MGLDSVELIMDMEREFGLKIPSEEAVNLALLGEMRDYIVTALRDRKPPVGADAVWARMSAVLVATGISPSLIKPTSHIILDLGLD